MAKKPHETAQYVVRTTQKREVKEMQVLYDTVSTTLSTNEKKSLDELLALVYLQGKEAAREEDANGTM